MQKCRLYVIIQCYSRFVILGIHVINYYLPFLSSLKDKKAIGVNTVEPAEKSWTAVVI